MTLQAPDGDVPLDFDALGLDVAEVLLRAEGVGVVRGVRLADGRRVVLKLHPPREAPDTIAAGQAIQAAHRAAGFPCPAPLIGPTRLGDRYATVETHLDWSGKHLRFRDGRVSAVYDWDSLRVAPETLAVGIAAMTFTTNFELDVP